MKVFTTIRDMRSACRACRTSPAITLGLVPTMGALHAGHLSLAKAAREACDFVAASIFVNPTQFGLNEDLARYPRTFEADCAALEAAGVDLLFAPTPEEMYPPNSTGTFVEVPGISDRLDGASRPGHLRGVTTVVSKLFNIVTPDRAYFGQKDAAQVAVLKAMVRDLNCGTEVVVCPIIRDTDGLALSSRNRYLTPEERRVALALPKALDCAANAARNGERRTEALLEKVQTHLTHAHGLVIDYVAAVDPSTLLPKNTADRDTLLAVAAWVGTTRLIDNLPLDTLLDEPAQ